jgi:cytochrome P450
MERAADVIVQVTREMLARWQVRPQPGVPIDIVREMSRLTLEIAARVLLSDDFASRSEEFGEAMAILNESLGQGRSNSPESGRTFADALAFIRRTVWQAILARRFYDTGEDDLLRLLLQAQRAYGDSEQHVIDQAVTILLAGHETTAKALSWTFALLSQELAGLARLHAELDANSSDGAASTPAIAHLRYTRAVIEEALRLYPPIWMLTRTPLQDDEISGYAIPAGALVAISPYLIHRHPDYWNLPDRFIPDRFLAGMHASWNYLYMPFGHGPRHCVGKFFAMLEMPLVLATVLSRFVLTLKPGHAIEPEALVTLRPRSGLPMIAIPKTSFPRASISRGA